jgi:hypothetical protein
MTRSRDPRLPFQSAFDLFESQFRTQAGAATSFTAAAEAFLEPKGIIEEINRSLALVDRIREAAEPAALREARAMALGTAEWAALGSSAFPTRIHDFRSLNDVLTDGLRSVAEMALVTSSRPEHELAAQLAASNRGTIDAILSRAEGAISFESLSDVLPRSVFELVSDRAMQSASPVGLLSMPTVASIVDAGSLAARSEVAARLFSESFAGQALALAASVALIDEPEARRAVIRELARFIAEHASKVVSSIGVGGLIGILFSAIGLILGHQESAVQRQEHADVKAEIAEVRDILGVLADNLAADMQRQSIEEQREGRDIYVVRVVGLRLRQRPSNKSKSIRTLQLGERIEGLGWKGRKWVSVSAFNVITGDYETGWVAKRYVRRLPRRTERP